MEIQDKSTIKGHIDRNIAIKLEDHHVSITQEDIETNIQIMSIVMMMMIIIIGTIAANIISVDTRIDIMNKIGIGGSNNNNTHKESGSIEVGKSIVRNIDKDLLNLIVADDDSEFFNL